MGRVNAKCMMDANLPFSILMYNVNLLILHAQLMKPVVLNYKIALLIQNKKNKCFYDDKEKKCVLLECKYLTYTTHEECNNQLSTCTSDSTKCVSMDKCETYSTEQCKTSLGTDGKCLFDPSLKKCRLASCTELKSNCSQITNCIDNGGLGCVNKANCSKYETEIACKQGGTDGFCVWYLNNGEGACKLMTSCSDGSSQPKKFRLCIQIMELLMD
ncbi:unnamed protein product (macronuclear) [Paramecium tetraurelia]|uniref:Uncharacterized protein n=1 Tax=Paramecium tetraurelia TaxID=5888 RepID=A0CGU1_PARTE|nr:uncharacterized protein GSPATT00007448001 [Paramecium tetraurelia]CAK70008.1 unnamed protein product [Paramecium tetraurelia]|eukprot:XP_001437405.1 hypothetical protein (macronuclear) [Paramecium tetraurelia strain d4-2]